MLNIELKNTKISLDEEKRPSNFILGYVQDPEIISTDITIGFMPDGYAELLGDLIEPKFSKLRNQIELVLLERDCAETVDEWCCLSEEAESILLEIEPIETLHMAFTWNSETYTEFEFSLFDKNEGVYCAEYREWIDQPSHLR